MRSHPALFRSMPCLLALGFVVLLAPLDASARTRDTINASTNDFPTSSLCFGTKIQADVDTVIEDFSVYLQNSSTKTLNYYVYESTTSSGTYTRIAGNQTTGYGGVAYGWESSGPLFANVTSGNYYVSVVCWNAVSPAITINWQSTNAIDDPSWGTHIQGVYESAGTPAASKTWTGTNSNAHMQIYTSAGSAISAGLVENNGNSSTNWLRGNFYDVTKDTLLTEVRQYVQGTTSSGQWFGSFSVPWYIYRDAGTCSSGQSFAQVTSYAGYVIGGSNVLTTSWALWNPNITLEAGYCYFIGIDFTATGTTGVANRYYYESTPGGQQADWGEIWGRAYAGVSSGSLPAQTESFSGTTNTVVLQRIGAVRDTQDEATASDTYSAQAGSEFGNIFSLTSPTHVSEMAVQVDPSYAGVINLGIYESASQTGAYTRIWEGEVEHDDTGKIWHISQEPDLDLDPATLGGTGYYLFVAEIEGAGVLYRDLTLGPSPSFGTHVGAHWANASTVGLGASITPSFSRTYDWRIVSCDTCVDIDGDGFELSDDCDDGDATINSAAVEICDGLDNDCDGLLLTGGESDADADGERSCDGDCDDFNANTYSTASEICDGLDNDCNATTPVTELDTDQDGFLTCDLDVDPTGSGLFGGGDCDDADSSKSPGLAFEICDGDDTNCDGLNWIGSTSEPTGEYEQGSGSGSGGGNGSATAIFGGVVIEANMETVITGVHAQVIAPSSTVQLDFAVYEAPSQSGPWTLMESRSLVVTGGAGAPDWVGDSPGNFGTFVTPGMFYLVGYHTDFSTGLLYEKNSQSSYPYPAAFGDSLGRIVQASSALPSGSAITNSLSTTRGIGLRIYTDSELDGDTDGYLQCADCDDGNVAVFPGAPELCDALDNDCDGSVPTNEVDGDGDTFLACDECNDSLSSVYPGAPELCDGIDNDCNGILPVDEQDVDSDGVSTCEGDCNDGDNTTYPASANNSAAPELCDGTDNDCNGSVPANEDDSDSDGQRVCGGDCNDGDAAIFTGNPEICDGLDNDCVSGVPTNEQDPDGDGFIQCTIAGSASPPPLVLGGDDCLINDPNSYPGAAELCDGIDNDCNNSVPANEDDSDFDGQRVCSGDCDDSDSLIGLNFSEVCDGNDSNCDGTITSTELDGDGDGYIDCTLVTGADPPAGVQGGGDCNDGAPAVYPGAPELCDNYAVDNNCNGTALDEGADLDGDGVSTCTDCDDADLNVFPGNPEICDGKDGDCASGVPTNEQDPDGDGFIQCTIAGNASLPAFVTGGDDCLINDANSYPGATELCDGIDNDCNSILPVNEQDVDSDGVSACEGDCNDGDNTTYPASGSSSAASELCDGIDNDCNGSVPANEDDSDSDGQRVCGGDCNDGDAAIFTGNPEICDGLDNDCVSGVPTNEQDPDGDGFIQCTIAGSATPPAFVTGGDDCLINDADSYPGAAELCDGIDNDCNGSVPVNEQDVDSDGVSACEGDCNDGDNTTYPASGSSSAASELCDGIDNDCNGSVPANEDDSDSDGQRVCGGDCNDSNAVIFTGNPEVCDGLDNDCSAGTIDDGFDADLDGFFDGANADCVNTYAQVDCDDALASIYPGAAEVCDGVDQDCDSAIDNGFDGDGDTFFDGADSGCVGTYGANADCDDGTASTYPGATEVCDGVDQNCDSAIDDGFDSDGDSYFDVAVAGCASTYGVNADCDDAVASINPGATETCNGTDDDCNVIIDNGFDVDADGFFDGADAGCVVTYGAVSDCDDTEVNTYPNAPELCDTEDNDCDGSIDEDFDNDLDGFFDFTCPGGDDCDDTNAAINPNATETCDGSDQDCDGVIDNGFDGDSDGYYDAADAGCAAIWGALADCDDGDGSINPSAVEICDGVDQDCDAGIDEDFDQDADGAFTESAAGCVSYYPAGQLDCDDTVATTYVGAPELCNGVDDDCDSPAVIDEGFDVDGDGFFDGTDADCVTTYGTVDCDDALASVFPGATEACNGLDDDCDGVVPLIEVDNDGDGFDECADGDCDDANNAVFAGALELCNGIDDNCAGGADEFFDADADGYTDGSNPGCVATYGLAGVDCDDTSGAINPGAVEVCNTLDDNCSGVADDPFDVDGDTYFEEVACAGQYASLDCDDTTAAVNPGQSEDCSNGIDDDCDGSADIGFDVDLDGIDTCNGDCDDSNAAISPTAIEVCDLIDNNCDQQVDEGFDVDTDGFTSCGGDCDDGSATVNPGAPELCDTLDNDCDGSIDEDFDLDLDGTYSGAGCSGAWTPAALDCDDGNPNINPSAAETCDGVDNDCDVDIDEDFDVDLDGAYDASDAGCGATYGAGADCDDAESLTYPGAVEVCDGVDNDCDTIVPLDEIDNDVDGYTECLPIAGHVGSPVGGDDCADGDAAINPGAAELCNLIDEDCDGEIDEDFDFDGDGAPDDSVAACQVNYPSEELDCDDTDPLIGPNAVEVCDGIDNNCDGEDDETFDLDLDGTFDGADVDCVAIYGAAGVDCDDANPNAFPGNVEDCTTAFDDNCNGLINEDDDFDGDGSFTCSGDCDDTDATINPSAIEICDGIDQNCDFVVDEIFDGDGDGFVDDGPCAGVYPAEELDCDDTVAAINPDATEVCNALDDDCDLDVDELFDLDSDLYFDRLDVGCIQTYGALETDCDDLDPTLNPGVDEVCNDLDDDCDGIVDEGFDMDADGVWLDDAGCNATYGGPGDCDDNDAEVHPEYDDGEGTVIPAADEVCDGLDNDCDGIIAEDIDVDGYLDAENTDCAGQDDLDCDDADATVNPDADEICDDEVDNDCDEAIDQEDPDCIEGDDDDSAGDDDDDDDATDSEDPPVVDPDFDGDGITLSGGCDSCLGSVAGPEPSGLGLGILFALGLMGWRRRRRNGGSGTRAAILVLAAGLSFVALAAPAVAQAQDMEQEAQRQLDFAWKDLGAEQWEKAVSSAESALRLNPALYTAMVVKALAYEGMGELRKAESWLQTYLELTRSLSQAPQAMELAERLKGAIGGGANVKAETTATIGVKRTAFGNGSVVIGGLLGARNYSQTPCSAGVGCEEMAETQPGFWDTNSTGFGGGLSVRAEYFFGGWLIGARVRYDLGSGEPIGAYGVTNHTKPGHRLDFNVVFRPQLVGGLTSVRLLADVGYGFRSWTVYETVSKNDGGADTAAAHGVIGHQVGGGIGVRVEPGQVLGIDFRYGLAGLLGGAGGINDHSIEVGVGIRPVGPLLIRAGFDMHVASIFVDSERPGGIAQRAGIDSLRAGLFIGAGVVF